MFNRIFIGACVATALFATPVMALTVRPATVAEGAAIASANDEVVRAWTPADINVRTQGGASRENLRRRYAAGVEAWSASDRARLTAMLARHQAQLNSIARWLPREVLLIRNSDAIEGGLPHTRANAILFGDHLPAQDAALDSLFMHELWHVLSRHNASRHDQLYALIGFQPCRRVTLPASLRARLLTNPDAPITRWGVPSAAQGANVLIAPLLLAEPAVYDAHHPQFTHYLGLRYIGLRRAADGSCTPYQAVPFIDPDAAVAAIYAVAGHNTEYTLHPEELLADNFEQLMMAKPNVPDPQVQARLAAWLGITPPTR